MKRFLNQNMFFFFMGYKKQKEGDCVNSIFSFLLYYLSVFLVSGILFSIFSYNFRSFFPDILPTFLGYIPITFVFVLFKIYLLALLFYLALRIFNITIDFKKIFIIWLETSKLLLIAFPITILLYLLFPFLGFVYLIVYGYVVYLRIKIMLDLSGKNLWAIIGIYAICLALVLVSYLLLINNILLYLEPFTGPIMF